MTLEAKAIKTIESYKSNKIIMDFINTEAMEQTAADIRAKTGSGTTAKAVSLMLYKNGNEQIKERFDHYVNAGLVGAYIASFNA